MTEYNFHIILHSGDTCWFPRFMAENRNLGLGQKFK